MADAAAGLDALMEVVMANASHQSRADAMADAETLRLNSHYVLADEVPDEPREARNAARLAFWAVPDLREPDLCTRWGLRADRCIRRYQHLGPCQDARGNSTLSLTAGILAGVGR